MILHLTLKKKWFDMIASGEKKEEYREIKPYWVQRLFNADFGSYDLSEAIEYMNATLDLVYKKESGRFKTPKFDHVVFRHGYAKGAPKIKVEVKGISTGKAKPEWSDNWQGDVFIIKLGEIIEASCPK